MLLTNEVQDWKDPGHGGPGRDWLTSARSLSEVKVWPCGCPKGDRSRNSKEAIAVQHSGNTAESGR